MIRNRHPERGWKKETVGERERKKSENGQPDREDGRNRWL